MWWQNDEYKEGFIASHEGPCEAWVDDTRIFQHDNCAAQFKTYPAKVPADYSSCKGDCLFVFYWLALHEPDWQIYKQCVPITNNGSGGSTTTQSSGSGTSTTTQSSGAEETSASTDTGASSTTQTSASSDTGASDATQTTDNSSSNVTQSEASTGNEASGAEQTKTTDAPSTPSSTPAPEATTATPEETDAPAIPEVTSATPTATEAPSTGKCGVRRRK